MLLAACVGFAGGCSDDSAKKAETTVVTTAPTTEAHAPYIEVETPYCTLKYPNKWPDKVKYSTGNNDGVYCVSFNCTLDNGTEHKMIDVFFGDSTVGSRIGRVLYNDQIVDFYVLTYDMPNVDTASVEAYEKYYEMLDGVNDIIESVMASPEYVK